MLRSALTLCGTEQGLAKFLYGTLRRKPLEKRGVNVSLSKRDRHIISHMFRLIIACIATTQAVTRGVFDKFNEDLNSFDKELFEWANEDGEEDE